MEAFAALNGEPWAHLFHAGDNAHDVRWSWIVAFPEKKLIVEDGASYIDGKFVDASLISILRSNLRTHASNAHIPQAPFLSGLAGYIGYEVGALTEPSLEVPSSPYALPDLAMGRYDAVAIFDRDAEQAFIVAEDQYKADRLEESLVECGDISVGKSDVTAVGTVSNFTEQAYIEAVSDIRKAILNGDFFQANISRRLSVNLNEKPDLYTLYHKMMKTSDAKYAAFLQFDYGNILSNSPEKFFSVKANEVGKMRVLAEPIKGTIARHKCSKQDELLKRQLQESAKDRAENIMIADLLRNDLSRVCEYDSICEDDICAIMSLTYVHHLVSRISGVLESDKDAADVFFALFPCGSITGAPKIEAMKAISVAEQSGRGPYCGAIGFFDDRGTADFSVAIRTLVQENDQPDELYIPVGGGITLRSDPEMEFEETTLKAKGFMRLFGDA